MNSTTWKNWITQMDFKSCLPCRKNHGKIYEAGKPMSPAPPAHPNCRCQILPLSAILAGTATKKGLSGADWYLSHFGFLPDYYISLENANQMGYDPKKNFLSSVIPDKTLFKGIYKNKNGHLPEKPGRIWYEADINYTGGKRGTNRILFSNDELIFVTYDHYHTFVEIIQGGIVNGI